MISCFNILNFTEDLKKEVDSLTAVAEESLPFLTPIEGPDQWESNRRYLMAPAIMAICPSNVYSLFQDTRKDASQDNRDAIFHSKNLGVAQVSQIKPSGLVKEEYHWSSRHFVLHQNYLLEHDKPSERPKGFAFLQNCSIRKVEETNTLLRFDYYQPERSSRKSVSTRTAELFKMSAVFISNVSFHCSQFSRY